MSCYMEEATDYKTKQEFEELFHEYADVVYRLALYKTSDEDVARDITQETFLRLWKSMVSKGVVKKPKQYMYQIARNLIVDHYKRHQTSSLEVLEESGFELHIDTPSAETLTDAALLQSAIEKLEPEFRDVVYLRFVEEMKVKDIAEMLDISPNLVSVRINRGKKQLEERYI